MGFSDQEEQLTNSAEDLETGETGSAEQSAALQAEAESSDIEVESSQEALESPGSEESTEIDSTETEPGDTEPEIDTQADAEIETQEPAAPDADDDQPLDIDQPPAPRQMLRLKRKNLLRPMRMTTNHLISINLPPTSRVQMLR